MLKTYRIIPLVFILFLVFGFSFIALQVTTEDAEAAPGVCEPVEIIRNMKDTARHDDYMLWVDRCQVSGDNARCGDPREWPRGDRGRCERNSKCAELYSARRDILCRCLTSHGANAHSVSAYNACTGYGGRPIPRKYQ